MKALKTTHMIKYRNSLIFLSILFLSSCSNHSIPGQNLLNTLSNSISRNINGRNKGQYKSNTRELIKSEIKIQPTILTNIIEEYFIKNNEEKYKNDNKLNYSIYSSSEGSITTDWEKTNGKIKGLLSRKYITEVRHTIIIERSYKSKNCSDLFIMTEVRDRPNPNYEWEISNPEFGEESLKKIKDILLNIVIMFTEAERINFSEN